MFKIQNVSATFIIIYIYIYFTSRLTSYVKYNNKNCDIYLCSVFKSKLEFKAIVYETSKNLSVRQRSETLRTYRSSDSQELCRTKSSV